MVEYSLDLQNINLSAIRTVRVLRPLKAINRVPSKSATSLSVGIKERTHLHVSICANVVISSLARLRARVPPVPHGDH